MRRIRTTTATGVAVLLATVSLLDGCGGSNNDSGDSDSNGPNGGRGTYAFEHDGAHGTVQVPGDTADPAFAEIEAYRVAVGAPPVTYYLAEVDNTEGEDEIDVQELVIVTDDGDQVEATEIFTLIGDWEDLEGNVDDPNNELNGIALYNAYLNNEVYPGAKGTSILASEPLAGAPARVYITPIWGEQVEGRRID